MDRCVLNSKAGRALDRLKYEVAMEDKGGKHMYETKWEWIRRANPDPIEQENQRLVSMLQQMIPTSTARGKRN